MKGRRMGRDEEWLLAPAGGRAVFSDGQGRRVEGFVELVDLELGIAWIRDHATGERRMVTRTDYPQILHA